MLNREVRRVLVVDDDRPIHRAVARILVGFELCSAYDGPSALAEVQTARDQRAEFALVVLDVDMPGWGGLDTLEQIDRHGGALSFDTAPDRGTTFTIRIPISGPPPRPAA